jgi:hypothetical protein
MEPTEEPK